MNLENYETVKERKKRFYKDNPDGRIIVKITDTPHLEYVICTACCYKNKEDQKENLAWSSGNALEVREKELSMSRKGEQYASVNYTSWLENCEESAVGRCLDNAGYAGNDKCSREEMEKVKRVEANSKVTPADIPIGSYRDTVEKTFPGSVPNTPDDVPAFDDIGKSDPAQGFSPGSVVPKEYWDDKKNPVYGNLWTSKNDAGVWIFTLPRGGR